MLFFFFVIFMLSTNGMLTEVTATMFTLDTFRRTCLCLILLTKCLWQWKRHIYRIRYGFFPLKKRHQSENAVKPKQTKRLWEMIQLSNLSFLFHFVGGNVKRNSIIFNKFNFQSVSSYMFHRMVSLRNYSNEIKVSKHRERRLFFQSQSYTEIEIVEYCFK